MTVLEVLKKMRSTDRAIVLANIGGVDVMRDHEAHTHIEKYASEYMEMYVMRLAPMQSGALAITATDDEFAANFVR